MALTKIIVTDLIAVLVDEARVHTGKTVEAKRLDPKIADAQLHVRKCTYVKEFMTKGLFFAGEGANLLAPSYGGWALPAGCIVSWVST